MTKNYTILDPTLKQVIVCLHSRAAYIYTYNLIYILCYIKGKKRGPMKRSEVFKNLIVDLIIFLFVLKQKSSDPHRRIFKSFS